MSISLKEFCDRIKHGVRKMSRTEALELRSHKARRSWLLKNAGAWSPGSEMCMQALLIKKLSRRKAKGGKRAE